MPGASVKQPSASAPVVECRSLSKRFRDFWLRPRVTAVEDLDLTIARGEVLGLLGPNGSGKSTTIKLILGLLHPSGGVVRLLGAPPADVRSKRRVGYLPEETHLYPFLDADETLDFYGRLFGLPRRERRRRIAELLEMVGLREARKRPVGEYSKGMQRRIGLAQALINDPELLILDEPTSGLDPIGSRQVKELLAELGRRGVTLLVSSHLLADVEAVCSRVVILYGGRIVAQGTVGELLTVSGESTLRCPALSTETVAAVDAFLRERTGGGVLEASPRRQPLEEFFLELVHEAQQRGEGTSGARSGGGLAPFLAGAAAPSAAAGDRAAATASAVGEDERPRP